MSEKKTAISPELKVVLSEKQSKIPTLTTSKKIKTKTKLQLFIFDKLKR